MSFRFANIGASPFGQSNLKRARLSHDMLVPSLPKIKGDIILEVFTHPSLRGNNARLAALGRAILSSTVTYLLYQKTPTLDASEIIVSLPGSHFR
jgi:dsRNA-specific ribonuclease